MLSDRTRSPSAAPRLAVRSPGATRTPPHRGLNPPSAPDDGAPPAIDGSPRRAGSELQVNVPLAMQVEPAQLKPKGTCDVSADGGDPLQLPRVASSSAAAALQSVQQPPPLPRVETSSAPRSRPSTPPPEDRWLLPSQVDAKLWPGAHAAGWSVMVRSKQSGHYWYISPQRVRYASRSQAQGAGSVPLAALRGASSALERTCSTDTADTVCIARDTTAPPVPAPVSRMNLPGGFSHYTKDGVPRGRALEGVAYYCAYPNCHRRYSNADHVRKHCRKKHGLWLKEVGRGAVP